MSQSTQSQLIDFVTHLTSDVNPYPATADFVAKLLLPCALPSWSRYVEYVFLAEFVIMFFQSSYILYVRSKTKKIHHIGLNDMGLILLDRANHCGLCYFLYSIIAVIVLILQPFVRSGHVEQGWPDFIFGIQFTLTSACAAVIIWLAICHCLLVQGYILRRSNPVGHLLPTTVAWTLNISLVVIIFVPAAVIIISYYQLAIEYHRIRQVVMPGISILRQKASTCSLGTCSLTHMIPELLLFTSALPHIDLVVHYIRIGTTSYVLFYGCILVIYIPVLVRLLQSFKTQRRLFRASQRQQDRVFANTFIEFVILLVTFVLSVYLALLIQGGKFIYNPNFFLGLSIGINGIISNLGNVALFLIICSQGNPNEDSPRAHIPILPHSSTVGYPKSDPNTSACYPYL